MREKDEWVQDCIFCEGTGIDWENSLPAEGPSYYSMGEPPHYEPCICQFDLRCSCGFGLAFAGECGIWCGNGHYDGDCPPIMATLRLLDD